MADFDYARDKVLMGAKREEVLSEKEKEKTAYHEAGHTLVRLEIARERTACTKSRSFPAVASLGVTHTVPDRRSAEHRRARTA